MPTTTWPKVQRDRTTLFRYNFSMSKRLYNSLVELAGNHGMTTSGMLKLMINIGLVLIPYLRKPGTTILVKDGSVQREIIVPLP